MNILSKLLFLILITLPILGSSQVTHTFHETYNLRDIQEVKMDLAGDINLVKWQGKQMMIETNIQISNATHTMLRFLMKQQRYDIIDTQEGGFIQIESYDKERQEIVTQDGHCEETVTVTIYVPNDFDIIGKDVLIRSDSEENAPIAGEE